MPAESSRHSRVLQRYRFMFRFSLVVVAASFLLLAVSVLAWMYGDLPMLLPVSLVLIDLAGLTAYKVLTSTARILEGVQTRE